MIGKKIILKTFGISKFIYSSNLISFLRNIEFEREKVLYEFIYGKCYKVKKDVFINNYDIGGLKMPDLDSIVKVQKSKWVLQYLNNHSGQWQHIEKINWYRDS